MEVAVLVGASLATVVAVVAPARRASAWLRGLSLPAWTPSPAVVGVVSAASVVGFGFGAGIAWQGGGRLSGLVAGTAAFTLAGTAVWGMATFRRRSLRDSFFLVCVVWVLAALAAAGMGAARPLAGLLAVPFLVVAAGVAVVAFAAWQLNPPGR